MAGEKPHAENVTRWWEFYAVRYAMGTVVGAITFCFLCLQRPETQPLLFGIFDVTSATAGSQSHSISLDASRLTLLAVYGLVYCYITSAPILVFHAGRFLIRPGTRRGPILKWSAICSVSPVLFGILAYRYGGHDLWFTWTASALGLLLGLQVITVSLALYRNAALFDFYSQLAERRSHAKGEIVDSYRHLREHGNSFFIVFLELALGVVLFEASGLMPQNTASRVPTLGVVRIYLAVIVAWILPAVFVWLISTLFERRFRDKEPSPREQAEEEE